MDVLGQDARLGPDSCTSAQVHGAYFGQQSQERLRGTRVRQRMQHRSVSGKLAGRHRARMVLGRHLRTQRRLRRRRLSAMICYVTAGVTLLRANCRDMLVGLTVGESRVWHRVRMTHVSLRRGQECAQCVRRGVGSLRDLRERQSWRPGYPVAARTDFRREILSRANVARFIGPGRSAHSERCGDCSSSHERGGAE